MSSFVDVKNVEPTHFEEQLYDEYEYYNISEKYTSGASRKGRTKKEASDNTNRPNPGGHERKLVEKLQNTEKKAKAANLTANPGNRPWPPWRQNKMGRQTVNSNVEGGEYDDGSHAANEFDCSFSEGDVSPLLHRADGTVGGSGTHIGCSPQSWVDLH